MTDLIRFGVSMTRELLERFDRLIDDHDYPTRSKAIEDLIRQAVTAEELSAGDAEVVGSIDIVYDHHRRELLNKLTDIQHDCQDVILSTQHIHLDHHNCFEIIIVKGPHAMVDKLASRIKAAKGVKHSHLRLVTTREA
jgi:CopG family transcriptional regulator, nickel-responsive regulator